jgi:hypothetical protein
MGAPVCDWLGLSSTSPSRGPTLPTRSSRCASTCTPREPHLTTAKHMLRYLQSTLDLSLLLRRASTSDLIVYTDADWVGCPRHSPVHFRLRGVPGQQPRLLVLQASEHHLPFERKAEYRVVANGVVEACWLQQLLVELHSPLSWVTLVYCDNVSAVYLSTNPVQREHCRRGRPCPPRPDNFPVRRHLHQGPPSLVFSEFRCSLNIYSG